MIQEKRNQKDNALIRGIALVVGVAGRWHMFGTDVVFHAILIVLFGAIKVSLMPWGD